MIPNLPATTLPSVVDEHVCTRVLSAWNKPSRQRVARKGSWITVRAAPPHIEALCRQRFAIG